VPRYDELDKTPQLSDIQFGTATWRTLSKYNVVLYSGPSAVPQYENMTSFRKPEVLNISQRRHRRTEPCLQATCIKIWQSSAVRVVFEWYEWTDRQTDKRTDILITLLRTPPPPRGRWSKNKKHLKNVGPIRYCEPFYIVINQVSLLPLLSHAACASMSTKTTATTTTTTTRDRGDRYGPME